MIEQRALELGVRLGAEDVERLGAAVDEELEALRALAAHLTDDDPPYFASPSRGIR